MDKGLQHEALDENLLSFGPWQQVATTTHASRLPVAPGDMMKNIYITGTPSLDETNMMWKGSLCEDPLTVEEWDEKWSSLTKHVDDWIPVYYRVGQAFVVTEGDCHGDRTIYVYIRLPEMLNIPFIQYLQCWTKKNSNENQWRILLTPGTSIYEAIIIYKDAISVSVKYRDMLLNKSLKEMAEMMRDDIEICCPPRPETDIGITKPRIPHIIC